MTTQENQSKPAKSDKSAKLDAQEDLEVLEKIPQKKGLSSQTKLIIILFTVFIILMGACISIVVMLLRTPTPVAISETITDAAASKAAGDKEAVATDTEKSAKESEDESDDSIEDKPANKTIEKAEEKSNKMAEEADVEEDDVEEKVSRSSSNEKVHTVYYTIKPAFVVNFQYKGRMRFLQVSVDIMAHEDTVINAIDKHSPRIKNDLVALFGAQDFEVLQTTEGRERLRAQALKVVQRILEEEIGQSGASQVLFTSFVMQ